ncbi:MAG TPA: type II toxin-antitoxin system Phd/YefM family antitoxin [Spirochaetales bacterium]|nr:type II toxin-antitoxin system Phd/YefM family antitoxin [Spirochaetales bacterium]
MNTVNALKIRNHFGEVLEMLDNGKEPILITKARKIRAVLIRYEDFQTRFLDKQANEERDRFFTQIKSHVLPSLINQDSVQTLRELRGYKD